MPGISKATKELISGRINILNEIMSKIGSNEMILLYHGFPVDEVPEEVLKETKKCVKEMTEHAKKLGVLRTGSGKYSKDPSRGIGYKFFLAGYGEEILRKNQDIKELIDEFESKPIDERKTEMDNHPFAKYINAYRYVVAVAPKLRVEKLNDEELEQYFNSTDMLLNRIKPVGS